MRPLCKPYLRNCVFNLQSLLTVPMSRSWFLRGGGARSISNYEARKNCESGADMPLSPKRCYDLPPSEESQDTAMMKIGELSVNRLRSGRFNETNLPRISKPQ